MPSAASPRPTPRWRARPEGSAVAGQGSAQRKPESATAVSAGGRVCGSSGPRPPRAARFPDRARSAGHRAEPIGQPPQPSPRDPPPGGARSAAQNCLEPQRRKLVGPNRGPALTSVRLVELRFGLIIAALILAMVGAITLVSGGGVLVLIGVVVLLLGASAAVVVMTFRLTGPTEHPSPELEARLVAEGVGDPRPRAHRSRPRVRAAPCGFCGVGRLSAELQCGYGWLGRVAGEAGHRRLCTQRFVDGSCVRRAGGGHAWRLA